MRKCIRREVRLSRGRRHSCENRPACDGLLIVGNYAKLARCEQVEIAKIPEKPRKLQIKMNKKLEKLY